MINIKTWVWNELNRSEAKTIPVTKIKCRNSGLINYFALVSNPKINAPYNYIDPKGECWVSFYKCNNKQHKIPILNHNQIIEV